MGSIEDLARLGLGTAEDLVGGLGMASLEAIATPIIVGFGSAEGLLDIIF